MELLALFICRGWKVRSMFLKLICVHVLYTCLCIYKNIYAHTPLYMKLWLLPPLLMTPSISKLYKDAAVTISCYRQQKNSRVVISSFLNSNKWRKKYFCRTIKPVGKVMNTRITCQGLIVRSFRVTRDTCMWA